VRRLAPLPPEARETHRQVLADYDSLGEQVQWTVGYTTNVSYAVPRRTTQVQVIGFYRRHLHGWRRRFWTVGRALFACFDRRGAIATSTTPA
jgi:hypothetical protein